MRKSVRKTYENATENGAKMCDILRPYLKRGDGGRLHHPARCPARCPVQAILAIDPGLSGGYCLLTGRGIADYVSGACDTVPAPFAWGALLHARIGDAGPVPDPERVWCEHALGEAWTLVIVEATGVRPGEGPVGAHQTGLGGGALLGWALSRYRLGAGIWTPAPAVWGRLVPIEYRARFTGEPKSAREAWLRALCGDQTANRVLGVGGRRKRPHEGVLDAWAMAMSWVVAARDGNAPGVRRSPGAQWVGGGGGGVVRV